MRNFEAAFKFIVGVSGKKRKSISSDSNIETAALCSVRALAIMMLLLLLLLLLPLPAFAPFLHVDPFFQIVSLNFAETLPNQTKN